MKLLLTILLLSCSISLFAEDTIPTLNIAHLEVMDFDELTLSSFEDEATVLSLDFTSKTDNLDFHISTLPKQRNCTGCLVGGITLTVVGSLLTIIMAAMWHTLMYDRETGRQQYEYLPELVGPPLLGTIGGVLLIKTHYKKKKANRSAEPTTIQTD